MRFEYALNVTDNEKILYFNLSWFDLTPEAQKQIEDQITQEMGDGNIFSWPSVEVGIVATKEKKGSLL